jgi:hypothetical protein
VIEVRYSRRRWTLQLVFQLLFLVSLSAGQPPPAAKTFDIFPLDSISRDIRTHDWKASTVSDSEVEVSGRLYQVFRDGKTSQEKFRVDIGRPELKWWVYGIRAEGDLNLDWKKDYVWYGGDDTSHVLYVFLSHGSGYKQLDVVRTVKENWTRLFPTIPVPDFDVAAASSRALKISLIQNSMKLILRAQIEIGEIESETKQKYLVDVAEPTVRLRQVDYPHAKLEFPHG